MLTEKEKEGFREILQNIGEDDLIALKDTVTNRLIAAQNKPEAIRAILIYTEDAVQLLKRKKLKRDLIFRYLARRRVPVSPNADKSKLIREVLAYWGTNVNPEADRQLLALAEVDDEEEERQDPRPAAQAAPPEPAAPPQAAQQGNLIDRTAPNNCTIAPPPPPPLTQQLAKQFVTWFFQQLNALSPHMAQGDVASDWGPQHFFNDCKLRIVIQSEDSRMDAFEGPELVSERFRCLVQTEGLLFNPNVGDDGTKGINERHGAVLVFACGTIHKEGLCLGVFEQRFVLIRDPLNANNWKIKFTDVYIKSESMNQTPRFEDMSKFPALPEGVL